MSGPRISVLIPTYNRAHYLPACVESVLQQTRPPEQVVVINDGSTDNTLEVLERYKGRIEYAEKTNGGKASALNLGLTRVKGDRVWVLDDDDMAVPDVLARHARALEEDPRIDITYGDFQWVTEGRDGQLRPGATVGVSTLPRKELFVHLLEKAFIWQCTMVVRTTCYREVGPFDESLVRVEDLDMVLRLFRRYQYAKVEGTAVYRRRHGGMRGTAEQPIVWEERLEKVHEGRRKVFEKWRGKLELHDYLPGHPGHKPLTAAERRQAYLQRMAMAGLKGMGEEMKQDLKRALAEPCANGLSEAEQNIFYRLVGKLPQGDPLFFRSNFAAELRQCCEGPVGRAIRRELIRAFCQRVYWLGRNGQPAGALACLRAALRLGGARVIISLVASKIRRTVSGKPGGAVDSGAPEKRAS